MSDFYYQYSHIYLWMYVCSDGCDRATFATAQRPTQSTTYVIPDGTAFETAFKAPFTSTVGAAFAATVESAVVESYPQAFR